MPHIPSKSPPDKTAMFRALCESRAYLYGHGQRDLIDSVDGCQEWAVQKGLVDEIGQDAVQDILAAAFLPYRRDLP